MGNECKMVWATAQELEQACARSDMTTARLALEELEAYAMHTESSAIRRFCHARIYKTYTLADGNLIMTF